MRIIVCVDEKGGMSFAGRRQSRDRVLCQRILEMTAGDRLWARPYTAGLFPDISRLCVSEDYLRKAAPEDWCFAETEDLTDFLDQLDRVVVYRWNRSYPSDRKFPEALLSDRWHLESCQDFAGSSHERITEEVYSL